MVQDRSKKKLSIEEKNFFSYKTAETMLGISQRTLQRWMEELEIEPMTIPDARKSFLLRDHIYLLREYKVVMRSKDSALINRYREARRTGNEKELQKLRLLLSVI